MNGFEGEPFADLDEAYASEHEGREWMDAQDYYKTASEVSGQCGKCGGLGVDRHGFTSCGVETYYVACEDCGYQWGHE